MEEEIKLAVGSLEPVRTRLQVAGGVRVEADALEENWVLDRADASLAAAGCLLRVRRCGDRADLTYKGPASFVGGVKRREEIESGVADVDALLGLLARVGFTVRRRYEKRRERWRLGPAEVALDTTPMGRFVEIEGPAERLPGLARDLGLDPGRALPGSYLALWDAYRADHPEAGAEMVFG